MDLQIENIQNFAIELQRWNAVYLPGEKVDGWIILNLVDLDQRILAIKLRAEGKAVIDLNTSDVTEENSIPSNEVEEEKYIHLYYNCFLSNCEDGNALERRENRFDFSFQIPREAPCSFEHRYGYIRYTLTAIIYTKDNINIEFKKAFSVIRIFDLKIRSAQSFHITSEFYQIPCCTTCFEDPIQGRFSIPTTLFVPGMCVPITIVLTKNFKFSWNLNISVKLEQCIKFISKLSNQTVRQEKLMVELKRKGMKPIAENTDFVQSVIEVIIPSLPPSDVEFCKIIHLNYNLHFILTAEGHNGIDLSTPILIGTIGRTNRIKFTLHPDPKIKKIWPVTLILSNETSNTSDTNTVNIAHLYGKFEPSETSKTDNIKERGDSASTRNINNPFSPMYPVYRCPE